MHTHIYHTHPYIHNTSIGKLGGILLKKVPGMTSDLHTWSYKHMHSYIKTCKYTKHAHKHTQTHHTSHIHIHTFGLWGSCEPNPPNEGLSGKREGKDWPLSLYGWFWGEGVSLLSPSWRKLNSDFYDILWASAVCYILKARVWSSVRKGHVLSCTHLLHLNVTDSITQTQACG